MSEAKSTSVHLEHQAGELHPDMGPGMGKHAVCACPVPITIQPSIGQRLEPMFMDTQVRASSAHSNKVGISVIITITTNRLGWSLTHMTPYRLMTGLGNLLTPTHLLHLVCGVPGSANHTALRNTHLTAVGGHELASARHFTHWPK